GGRGCRTRRQRFTRSGADREVGVAGGVVVVVPAGLGRAAVAAPLGVDVPALARVPVGTGAVRVGVAALRVHGPARYRDRGSSASNGMTSMLIPVSRLSRMSEPVGTGAHRATPPGPRS